MPFYRRPTAPAARPTGGYAVVDLETTGLSPASDQILEIGLVHLDATGAPLRRWSTLVRPAPGADGRLHVGPTAIHGLSPADLADAPVMADVADLLARDLAGRVVVAHNARFDLGFLAAALRATGHLAPGARVPRLCTMEWARHYMAVRSRRLTTCCEAAGVPLAHHHSALADAEAAAALLRHYLGIAQRRGQDPPWLPSLSDAARFPGWTWDAALADQGAGLLVTRRRHTLAPGAQASATRKPSRSTA